MSVRLSPVREPESPESKETASVLYSYLEVISPLIFPLLSPNFSTVLSHESRDVQGLFTASTASDTPRCRWPDRRLVGTQSV